MGKFEIIFGVIVIILFGGIIFSMTSPKYSINPFDNEFTLTQKFCENNGYYSISISGIYMEYKNKGYGKVECVNFYVEGAEYTTLNVTKDWRGNLKLFANLGANE